MDVMLQYTSIISIRNSTSRWVPIKHHSVYRYDAVHSMKETLKKGLIADISSIREMIERNEIKVTRIEKERQISDVLTKVGMSSNEFLNVLSTSKTISL